MTDNSKEIRETPCVSILRQEIGKAQPKIQVELLSDPEVVALKNRGHYA